MQREECDVVVVGGGPGGASAATMLARGGRTVILLERAEFPRFQIGESLLPACWELWRKLGVTEKLEAEGFTIKQGINFGMFDVEPHLVLLTAEYPDYFERPYTFHVERARFDQILLEHARECGVDVRQPWSAERVLFDGERAVGVIAKSPDGGLFDIRAQAVVDASGRDCLIARSKSWRKPHPELNKVAHFSHFEGAWRRKPADIISIGEVIDGSVTTDIHTIDGGWIWYIPLRNGITSVGAVLDARAAKQFGDSPQTRFERAVQTSACVRTWLKDARQTLDMKTISSIGYQTEHFHGDGFVLVGDASMFVDPVFSAGVTLALRSGVYAAEAILEGFAAGGDLSAERLRSYEVRIRKPMDEIFKMIANWYRILEQRDADNILLRARNMPMLRERFVVLLSGGYDKVTMDQILSAGHEPAGSYLMR